MQVSVTTTTLDLRADKPLPAIPRDRPYRLMQSQRVCPELNRFLYTAVGFGIVRFHSVGTGSFNPVPWSDKVPAGV